MKLTDFWTTKLKDIKFVLFLATKFVVIFNGSVENENT